ncbi:MAG TPA: hypothetical protein VF014_14105 [Casimicrobiaceae bacterium]|nr:hypothetical protein [Casimicrobiaceae bacterium]
MNTRQLLFVGASILASALGGVAAAQEMQGQYVQIAEIEIDPAQLEDYKAAVREHAETAIRVEPGVLVLYAVSEKDILPTSGCLKSTSAPKLTGRTWRRCILRNTKP